MRSNRLTNKNVRRDAAAKIHAIYKETGLTWCGRRVLAVFTTSPGFDQMTCKKCAEAMAAEAKEMGKRSEVKGQRSGEAGGV